ncbi:MAG: FapA family protein [Treponema sp.]|nr:FapA family protein [Treponema sp.]
MAGGVPLEMKMVGRALRESGVQGIDTEKLKADIKSFMEGKETELLNYPLALGKASTRGRDRELEITVTFLEEASMAPILDRLGRAGAGVLGEFSLEGVTGIAPVEKDAVIARMGQAAEGEPGRDVFGTVLPGLPGNDPELKLFQGLAQHGTGITASRGGLLLVKAAERSFQAAVIEYRDARAVVTVSEDAMTARGDLFAAAGAGLPLTAETVMKSLAAAGVVKGIDKDAVERAVKTANEKGRCTGLMLARGEPPLAKNVPHVRWLVPIEWTGLLSGAPVSAETAGGKDAAGNVPPGERPAAAPASVEAAVAAVAAKAKIAELPVKIQTMQVNAGTPLAEIHPGAPEGRPGWDLRGAVLGPERGITAPLRHDDSVTETPAGDGVRLGAARSGTLHFDGRELKISSLKGIRGDVGKATGNISFPGELRIQGNVASGFSVMAGLNVLIGGGVESSLVSAGGKAVIAGSVRGAGRGVVRARSTIETAFVEEATLLAVDDIKVAKGCVRCNIKTNGRLLITGETGRLAGGVCRARRGVEVQELGSEKGGQTEISFGQDYLVKDQIEMLEGELARINAALKRIEERIAAAADPAVLNAARAEKVRGLKMREQLNMKLFTLREKFEVHHESELRVRGPVHPGVVMESHGRYYEVNQRRTGVVFYFDRATGRIGERGL